MSKLLKLSENHYIIVDDSKKGQRGYNYNFGLSKVDKLEYDYESHSTEWNVCRLITHSTQPLETVKTVTGDKLVFYKIKPLSLSEVQELIYGYSVKEMREDATNLRILKRKTPSQTARQYFDGYVEGFNAHKELMKDKLFTVDDMINCFNAARQTSGMNQRNQLGKKYQKPMDYIQLLIPKTEWQVEFDEQGKLKLVE